MTTTKIISNGGGKTLPISALFDRLASNVLDRTFEAYGNFVEIDPLNEKGAAIYPSGTASFFGNFFDYSHVFNIATDDRDLIDRLTAAIRANQQRADYLAQQTPEERAAELNAQRLERDRSHQEQRERHARSVLGLAP